MLSPDFINEVRALVFRRKGKFRRKQRVSAAPPRCWEKLGYGLFGEAWAHEDYPDLVVKISGREGFGPGARSRREPDLDGWPVFAEYCAAHPHPNLPNIMHFERLSPGVSFGIMPRYEKLKDCAIAYKWSCYLEGTKGAPAWMWPIIGMRGALNMVVDLHGGNVMLDPATGEYIMTDPFSGTADSRC